MTFEQLIPLIIMAFALGMDAFSVSLGMGMMPHAHQLKNENKMNFRSNKLKNT
ncbi:hypothetical protein BCER1_53940 [Bacillus cereus]|nr:hypothetical protein BCER1_53940 [Bacillus cereus]